MLRRLKIGIRLVACGAVLASGVGGCLEDLGEPIDCPAPAARAGSIAACAVLLTEPHIEPPSLCLRDPEQLTCYRDPAAGCGCQPSECSDEVTGCYPPGDCPVEVTDAYPGASCIRLAAEDIGPFQDEQDQCLCGCERCMAVCDGHGPVWAQLELDDGAGESADPNGYITLDVRRHVPAEGTLGLYVRGRGVVAGLVEGAPIPPALVAVYTEGGQQPVYVDAFPSLLDDRFEEELLPAYEEPYSWSSSAAQPAWVVLAPSLGSAPIFEIDCVVPFVIP